MARVNLEEIISAAAAPTRSEIELPAGSVEVRVPSGREALELRAEVAGFAGMNGNDRINVAARIAPAWLSRLAVDPPMTPDEAATVIMVGDGALADTMTALAELLEARVTGDATFQDGDD